MTMRVQVVDKDCRVVVPPEAVEALGLGEGSVVEIESVEKAWSATHRYLSFDEMRVTEDSVLSVAKVDGVYQIYPYDPDFAAALKAFRETIPEHRNTYRELANRAFPTAV